jgi:anti-anti-sigma regulatory factor
MSMLISVTPDATRFCIPTAVSMGYAKALRESVREALKLGVRSMIVDCDNWSRLDMNVLSSLIQCAAMCREYGAEFEVANMPDEILKDVRALRLEARLGLA